VLPDELLEQAKHVARKESASLQRLIEESLYRILHVRRKRERCQLNISCYGRSRLILEFERAGWWKIRAIIAVA